MTKEERRRRQTVWLALSELYLDTELNLSPIQHSLFICERSGFSLKEVQKIDYYEVAPLLSRNLLSPAGIWSGFETSWLYQQCEINYHRRHQFLHKLKCFYINLLIRKPLFGYGYK